MPGGVSDGSRLHGQLEWMQYYDAIKAGSQGVYLSMYDEFNEGNMIAKTAENSSMIPANAPAGLNKGLDTDASNRMELLSLPTSISGLPVMGTKCSRARLL